MTAQRERPLVVVALGGNALLRRDDKLNDRTQRHRAREAARSLADLAREVDLVITHGNGPQVGMLANAQAEPRWPLDTLVAETQGMIGYVLASALDEALGAACTCVVLTRVVVDPDDPAFDAPTKPIGPVFPTRAALEDASATDDLHAIPDGDGWRRVVASPRPCSIVELHAIRQLRADGRIPVCCGGGGVPVTQSAGETTGVEAVIDKDATSALLATELHADGLLLLTDVDSVQIDFGTARASRLEVLDPSTNSDLFAAGSMRPKVDAARAYARRHPRGRAVIGSLAHAPDAWHGRAGTRVVAGVAVPAVQ